MKFPSLVSKRTSDNAATLDGSIRSTGKDVYDGEVRREEGSIVVDMDDDASVTLRVTSSSLSSSIDDLCYVFDNKKMKNYTCVDMSQSPPVTISSIVKFKAAPSLNAKFLYKIPMTPVNATFGIVTKSPHATMPFAPMVKYERRQVKSDITMVFAIRRPGCGACRDHGRQLTQFAKKHGVCLVGAIKQIHVDDAALIEFYKNYFRHPLYMDKNWDIFKALGSRKISLWKLLALVPKMEKRYKERSIENIPFGGDIFTQGGILILDRKGQLRYAHYENYGEELDFEEFEEVIQDIRSDASSSTVAA